MSKNSVKTLTTFIFQEGYRIYFVLGLPFNSLSDLFHSNVKN